MFVLLKAALQTASEMLSAVVVRALLTLHAKEMHYFGRIWDARQAYEILQHCVSLCEVCEACSKEGRTSQEVFLRCSWGCAEAADEVEGPAAGGSAAGLSRVQVTAGVLSAHSTGMKSRTQCIMSRGRPCIPL